MNEAELWVLGNLTIDDVVRSDGSVAMGMCGGNAIYAAIGARVWSDRVGLSARVGPDYPATHLETLERAGIALQLSPVPGPSIHNWALYEGPDTRRFIPWIESGSHLDQSLLPREVTQVARSARVCHIAPMPLSVQAALIHDLSGGGPLISLDPHDEYIPGHAAELLNLLPRVSLFLPSRQEARLIFGRDAPEDAARAFAAAGPRVVVIKLGPEGSLICEAGSSHVHHVRATSAQVVDPTGAGDAYCGAFGVVYGRTGDALAAARHASVAASFIVERLGATSTLPFDREQADDRLRTTFDRDGEGALLACAWTTWS
jgi:sugar/nucleoside kinase (ribokinase family)